MKGFRGASCSYLGDSITGSVVKKSSFQRIQSLGLEDPTEREMATLSSLLAWETPWTEDESDMT